MSHGTSTAALAQAQPGPSSTPAWLVIRDPLLVESNRRNAGEGRQSRSTSRALRRVLKQHTDHVSSRTWRKRGAISASSGQYSMLDVALFLEKVYSLSATDEHGAVDAVYDFVDDCLLDGDFTACAAALASAHPGKMPDSVILSFLIITQRAKDKLAGSRLDFFDKAVAAVTATKGRTYAEELLGKNR